MNDVGRDSLHSRFDSFEFSGTACHISHNKHNCAQDKSWAEANGVICCGLLVPKSALTYVDSVLQVLLCSLRLHPPPSLSVAIAFFTGAASLLAGYVGYHKHRPEVTSEPCWRYHISLLSGKKKKRK